MPLLKRAAKSLLQRRADLRARPHCLCSGSGWVMGEAPALPVNEAPLTAGAVLDEIKSHDQLAQIVDLRGQIKPSNTWGEINKPGQILLERSGGANRKPRKVLGCASIVRVWFNPRLWTPSAIRRKLRGSTAYCTGSSNRSGVPIGVLYWEFQSAMPPFWINASTKSALN